MITVPASLKNEIQKLRGRKLQARCRFDFSDTTIDNTIIGLSNSHNARSHYSQLYNGKEDVTRKWFSLDGHSKLDGTYHLAPETESGIEKLEMGWWSEALSNDEGSFPTHKGRRFGRAALGRRVIGRTEFPPSVMVNFTERQVQEINISFDNARIEYAIDFTVILYSLTGTILGTYPITGNGGLKYNVQITPVSGVAMMELKITKWSLPHASAKVAEMFTMVSMLINGKDLKSSQVVEDRELSKDSLPVGTTSSGSCVLKFYNRDRLFDYDNPTSRLYNYIRKGVKMTPEIGDGVNWVPMGVFFVNEWDVPKDDIFVTATGFDIMSALDESEYSTSADIEAPDDQSVLVDTGSEWSSAMLNGVIVSGDTLRMAFS